MWLMCFCETPFRFSSRASSPWAAERRASSWEESAGKSWSTGQCSREATRCSEEGTEAAWAAVAWFFAPLNPSPPIPTGSLACPQALSSNGHPSIRVKLSLVFESKSCNRSMWLEVSTVRKMKDIFGSNTNCVCGSLRRGSRAEISSTLVTFA